MALLIAVVVGVVVAAMLDGVQRSASGEPSTAVGIGLIVLLLGWPIAYYSQRRP